MSAPVKIRRTPDSERLKMYDPMPEDKFDFYDFGCGSGGNLSFVQRIFPDLLGLGIDIDPKKISVARDNNLQAILYDILKIDENKTVDFITMAHFLEHLNSLEEVSVFIKKAIKLARSFVHIRQPFFDADGALFQSHLKMYWSDWRGHKNNTTSLDFYKIGRDLLNANLIKSFEIYGRGIIDLKSNDVIGPVSLPIDSGRLLSDSCFSADLQANFNIFNELVVVYRIDFLSSDVNLLKLNSKLSSKMNMRLIYSSDQYQSAVPDVSLND